MGTMQDPVVQNFLFGTPMNQGSDKGIYAHGALRKVSVLVSNPSEFAIIAI